MLILLIALVAWTAVLAPAQTRAIELRLLATGTQHRSQAASTDSAPPTPRIEERGRDVVFEDYPLTDGALTNLRRGDRIALPHPDGGTVELRVERADSADGHRHLLLVHDGLVSTFTEARGAFFGTVATPRGVYALEGDARGSRLTRHASLDQRMNSHALDYRNGPAS